MSGKYCWRCGGEKPASEFNPDPRRGDGLRATCRACVSVENASYRRRNRERVLARERAFAAAHPDRVLQKRRRFYARHAEAECERAARYRKANPLLYREAEARQRAKCAAVQVSRVDYAAIRSRDEMVCYLCAGRVAETDLHFDHEIPLSKGGAHVESNIRVTHAWCNRSKGNRLLESGR